MPYTEEQLMALKGASDESKRALFDRMSDSEKSELGQAMSDYMAKSQPKAEQPLADWQKKLKNIKLPNGAITQVRPGDNGIWMDQARGLSADKKPGWYDLTGKRLPYAPEKTLGQKIKSLPLSPLGAAIEKTTGLGWFNPNVGNVVQGAKRAYESLGQLALKVPTSVYQALPDVTSATNMASRPIAPAGSGMDQFNRQNAFNQLKNYIRQDEAQYAAEGKPNMIGETIGGMAAVPIPGGGAVKGASLAAKLAAAGLRAGTESALMTPVTSDDSFAAEKAKQFGIGAGLGVTGQGLMELGSAGLNRLRPILERAKAVEQATGATPTLGDVSNSQVLKAAENASEIVPFGGTVSTRLKQANQMAAKLGQLAAPDAQAGGAQEVAASARRALQAKRAAYGEPYQFVKDMIDSNPGSANFTNAYQAANDALAKIELPELSKGTVDAITTAKTAMENRLNSGVPITFDALKNMRSTLGDLGAKAQQAGDRETARMLFGIKSKLGQDMLDAADAADPSGFTRQTLENADKEWGKRVAKFDPFQSEAPAYAKGAIKALHQDPDFAEDGVAKILNSNQKNLPAYINEALDEPGRAALRKQLLDQITETATSGKTGISPLKLKSAIEKKEAWIKALFPDERADQLLGFAKAASTMERAGQILQQQTTGWGGMKMEGLKSGAAAGLGSAIGATKVLGGIAGTRAYMMLTATKAGQNFLRKMSLAADPGSKYAQAVLRADLPKAIAAAKATGNFPELEEPTQEIKP